MLFGSHFRGINAEDKTEISLDFENLVTKTETVLCNTESNNATYMIHQLTSHCEPKIFSHT